MSLMGILVYGNPPRARALPDLTANCWLACVCVCAVVGVMGVTYVRGFERVAVRGSRRARLPLHTCSQNHTTPSNIKAFDFSGLGSFLGAAVYSIEGDLNGPTCAFF